MRTKKDKLPANWKRIPVFCVIDRVSSPHDRRDIVHKEIIVNMDNFIDAVPMHYGIGYGKGTVVAEPPLWARTLAYDNNIAFDEYVVLHFRDSTSYYMYTKDFCRLFGVTDPLRVVSA